MNVEELRDYCLNKTGVSESFPFDQNTFVFKVGTKMFLLFNLDNFTSFNVKCDPEYEIELREKFTAVQPGFHMNKKHWNTVSIDLDVHDKTLFDMVDHSYDCVVKSMTKKERIENSL